MSVLSAWIVTVFVHSSILVGLALAAALVLGQRPEAMSGLWKAAVFGGLVTAAVHVGTGGWSPWSLASPPVIESAPVEELVSLEALEPPTSSVALASVALPPLPKTPQDPIVDESQSWAEDVEAAPSPWLDRLAWLVGIGFVLAMLGWIRGAVHLQRQLAGSIVLTQDPLRIRLDRLLATSGHRGTVTLVVAPEARVPMATGLVRPTIAVPPAALTLPPEHQDAMLAHELAHVQRRDPLWRLAAALVQRMFFFQPLLRIGTRGLAHAAELACDDWATRTTGQPFALARCLTEVAAWSSRQQGTRLAIAAMGMPGRRSALRHRVQRLIEAPNMPSPPRRWLGASVGSAMLGLVALLPGVASGKHENGSRRVAITGGVHVAEHGGELVLTVETDERTERGEPTIIVLDEAPSRRVERKAKHAAKRKASRERREAKRRVRRAFREARREHRPGPTSEEIESIFGTRERDDDRDGESVVVMADGRRIVLRTRKREDHGQQRAFVHGGRVYRFHEPRRGTSDEARVLRETEEKLRQLERTLRELERTLERNGRKPRASARYETGALHARVREETARVREQIERELELSRADARIEHARRELDRARARTERERAARESDWARAQSRLEHARRELDRAREQAMRAARIHER